MDKISISCEEQLVAGPRRDGLSWARLLGKALRAAGLGLFLAAWGMGEYLLFSLLGWALALAGSLFLGGFALVVVAAFFY